MHDDALSDSCSVHPPQIHCTPSYFCMTWGMIVTALGSIGGLRGIINSTSGYQCAPISFGCCCFCCGCRHNAVPVIFGGQSAAELQLAPVQR